MPPQQPSGAQSFNALLDTFTSFLTIFIHELLFLRDLYPATSFLLTRAYNTPVHQNRHPKLCQWINDAVAAVHTQLLSCNVARIAVVIYSAQSKPLERYVLDVSRFPVVDRRDRERELVHEGEEEEGPEWLEGLGPADLEEQLRATLLRLGGSVGKLRPLPEGEGEECTFSLVLEIKDEEGEPLQPPTKHPQPWIPVEPNEQVSGRGESRKKGRDVGGVKTTPVRAVEAGECLFEVWVEEAAGKFKASVEDDVEDE